MRDWIRVVSRDRGLNASRVLVSWILQMKSTYMLPINIFLPRINRQLKDFADGHARAPIATEHNKSPEQLWISGLLNVWDSNNLVAAELEMVNMQ